MTKKKILINAKDPEETRVAVIEDQRLFDFDSETTARKPIRGNIYLGRVVHVEPALQAVFVEYAEGKNGFLSFSEIHPDYYRIPVGNREKANEKEEHPHPINQDGELFDFGYPLYEDIETESLPQKKSKNKQNKLQEYSVQEVIHNKQVLLVQVIKDERGTKSAALTTYLSLAGQYCVLMPNAGERNGGVSKRIHKDDDRRRLKEYINDLSVPEKMAVIVRTAGQERTKAEIKKDYEYLLRLWDDIREKALQSMAPQLIHEDACLLLKAIRDFYKKDVEEVWVDTQEAYTKVRSFMARLSKSGVKKVKYYGDDSCVSLFNAFNIEQQILEVMSPRVDLPSGGSLVIMQTEALVSIDINSGRATKERNIDSTALKTNLEAAKEIARQIRLRDLSGLIVIDFIDMHDPHHIRQVEKAFRREMLNDHARVQIANMSQFCLLEVSRQRLKSSIAENYSEVCPHCQGRGVTYSKRYFLSTVLHFVEKIAAENLGCPLVVYTPYFLCQEMLNNRRRELFEIEHKTGCLITVTEDANLSSTDFLIDCGGGEVHQFSLDKKIDDEIEDLDLLQSDHQVENHLKPNKPDKQDKTLENDHQSPQSSQNQKKKKNDNNKESAPEEKKNLQTSEDPLFLKHKDDKISVESKRSDRKSSKETNREPERVRNKVGQEQKKKIFEKKPGQKKQTEQKTVDYLTQEFPT